MQEKNAKETSKNRYSDVIITDDNMDEEFEKLAKKIGVPFSRYEGFVEKLDERFVCQESNLGFEEWILTESHFTPGNESSSLKYLLAYEFGNGFVVVRSEEPI